MLTLNGHLVTGQRQHIAGCVAMRVGGKMRNEIGGHLMTTVCSLTGCRHGITSNHEHNHCTTRDLEALETLGHDRQLILFFLSSFLSSCYLCGCETPRFSGPDDLVIKHSLTSLSFPHSLGEVLLLFPSPPCATLTLASVPSAIPRFPPGSLFTS